MRLAYSHARSLSYFLFPRLHRSLADSSVTELLVDLEEQMADESSSLRSGNVTSAAKGFTYSTAIVDDSNSTESSSGVIGLSVVAYQAKGLFGFAEVALYTTEASKAITLTIQRNHGTKGVMDIGYATLDGSATGGNDYVVCQGTVRFYSGDTSKTFEIPLMDDADAEPHFEIFTVSLSLQGPINEGAALMLSATAARIFLYDYGDGVALASTTFAAATKDSASSAKGDLSFGWAVTDNGGEQGWVDSNGFAAKDAVFGADEYGMFHKVACVRLDGSAVFSIQASGVKATTALCIMGPLLRNDEAWCTWQLFITEEETNLSAYSSE